MNETLNFIHINLLNNNFLFGSSYIGEYTILLCIKKILLEKQPPDDIPTNKFIAYFFEASFPLACEEFQNHRERTKDSLEIPGGSPCFSDGL